MFAVQVDVNLVGTFRTVRACLPHLVESRGYALLNASATAIMAPPGLGAYGATKAGIESMGDTLRREVAHLGVDVGVLYLLWVQTDMVEGSRRESAVLATVLSGLGGPLGKAMPLARATRTIVAGIEQRKRRVTAPRIVGAMHRVRGLIGRPGRARAAEARARGGRGDAPRPRGRARRGVPHRHGRRSRRRAGGRGAALAPSNLHAIRGREPTAT